MKMKLVLICVAFATLALNTASAQLTEAQSKVVKATADYISEKAEQAAKHNVYVHTTKGDRAHILYDTKTKNAIPITVFQNDSLTEVTFCKRDDPDVLLEVGKMHSFQINKMDCYVIYKNDKVFVINTVTNQLGTIILKTESDATDPKKGDNKTGGG